MTCGGARVRAFAPFVECLCIVIAALTASVHAAGEAAKTGSSSETSWIFTLGAMSFIAMSILAFLLQCVQ